MAVRELEKGLQTKKTACKRQERTHQVAPEKDEKGWDGGEMKLER